MAELLSFLIVITAGLFFAEFFKPFHMPYVVALILGGMLIGPYGYNLLTIDKTIDIIGQIGLVFLMFMAGLETRLSTIAKGKKNILLLSSLNAIIPFIVGIGIAIYFGYDWISALFLGTIFISSSIAVIIPSLESNNLLTTKLGKTILGATILEDILSLIVFSFLLQFLNPTYSLPLPIFYLVIFFFLVFLRAFIKELRKFYLSRLSVNVRINDIFEKELRFVFAILLGTVILFELLGLHPIIAGFFAGMVLSESIKKEVLKEKLHALSYGLFIPVFFVLIGTRTEVSILLESVDIAFLVIAILIGSVGSKFASGFLAGKLSGCKHKDCYLIGASTVPQLSTTLAVAFTGLELGIIDQQLVIAMTTLSIVTTIVGPYLMRGLAEKKNNHPNVNI